MNDITNVYKHHSFKLVMDDVRTNSDIRELLGENITSKRDCWVDERNCWDKKLIHSDFTYFYNENGEEIAFLSKSLRTHYTDTLYIYEKPKKVGK